MLRKLRNEYEDMYIDSLKDHPKTYIKYVRNAPKRAIEEIEGGKSRKHRKYKKRTHKNLH